MKINELKSNIQSKALDAWITSGYKGVVVLVMGSGKSKLGIDCITTTNPKKVLITSPRTTLKESWLKELRTWNYSYKKIVFQDDSYHVDIGEGCQIDLVNVQTCYKWGKDRINQYDLVVIDEVHKIISPEYSNLVDKALELNKNILGLTGTPVKEDSFKGDYYNTKLPIIFEYYDSAKDGLINKSIHYIFKYELSDNYKVEVGNSKKKWQAGELKQYTYLSERYEKAKKTMAYLGADNFFETSIKWMRGKDDGGVPYDKDKVTAGRNFFNSIRYRKEFLWGLESSACYAREIAFRVRNKKNNKILYFSALTKQAQRVCRYNVHSKKTADINASLIEQFNKGEIKELASCDMLTLGLNLVGANWIIMESFNGSESNNLQKVARGARLDVNEICNVVWIVPKDTQAETWLNSALANVDAESIVEVDNLNLIPV